MLLAALNGIDQVVEQRDKQLIVQTSGELLIGQLQGFLNGFGRFSRHIAQQLHVPFRCACLLQDKNLLHPFPGQFLPYLAEKAQPFAHDDLFPTLFIGNQDQIVIQDLLHDHARHPFCTMILLFYYITGFCRFRQWSFGTSRNCPWEYAAGSRLPLRRGPHR